MRRELHIERFERSYTPEPMSGCWLWLGSLDSDGYAVGHSSEISSSKRMNRKSWALFRGAIPHGLCVLHSCDNPPCVNPAHLFLGTQADNQHDRHAKGRYATGANHHWHSSRSPMPSGERHPSAKLTDAQVEAIRAEYVDIRGEQSRLARKHGISVDQVHLIVRNKTRLTHNTTENSNG